MCCGRCAGRWRVEPASGRASVAAREQLRHVRHVRNWLGPCDKAGNGAAGDRVEAVGFRKLRACSVASARQRQAVRPRSRWKRVRSRSQAEQQTMHARSSRTRREAGVNCLHPWGHLCKPATTTPGYLIRKAQDAPSVPCPCGTSTRILTSADARVFAARHEYPRTRSGTTTKRRPRFTTFWKVRARSS